MLFGLLKRQLVLKNIIRPHLYIHKLKNQRFFHLKYLIKMNEAYVRYNKENETFNVSFRYINKEFNIDRQYNFNRQATESVETFLHRIDVNVSKTLDNKRRKKKRKEQKSNDNVQINLEEEAPNNVAKDKIKLLHKDDKIDNSVICKEILEKSSDVILEVLGMKYTLNINSPWIESIKLPTMIMAGFPIYPVKFETLNVKIEDSIFKWYKNDINKVPTSKEYWKEISHGFYFTPEVEDIGRNLKLICEPKNGDRNGPESEVLAIKPIVPGPGPCPFETRHAFTSKKLSGKSFRVMSYNLLANAYAATNYSRDTLFPYCPNYALDIEYRKQLFIKEILGYNSDIICLQEVDHKIFDNDLKPILKINKYEGMYTRKGIELSEGLAMFYNSERFEKLNSDIVVMSQNVEIENFSDTWSKIINEKTKERFLARNTTVQSVILKSIENPNNIFVVGNTHLYFHPDADHIRLLQGYYTLMYIQNIIKNTKAKYPDCKVHMILCGDFNSVPENGIYQLYTQNYIPENCIDWNSNSEEKVENLSLSHEYKIASACGMPQYTNYTMEFNGCLDYIFYETNHLKVLQVIPMPSDEEVKLYKAIPSPVFPSDHISICADLELTT